MTREEILLSEGLDFNILFILQNIKSLPDNIKVRGWKELAIRKGYIDRTDSLTEKGISIVELFEEKPKEEKVISKKEEKAISFEQWCIILHKKLQDLLVKRTGKKQKTLYGGYPFLCNAKDLEGKLKTVINKYKITNLEKCEKVLINYIEKSIKSNFDKVKIMQYYIMKDGFSLFYTDYEQFEDEQMETPTLKEGVEI
jgi:hypothetical protein